MKLVPIAALMLWTSACTSDDPAGHLAGAVEGKDVRYDALDEHHVELFLKTGKPVLKFGATLGTGQRLELFVISDEVEGPTPATTSQAITSGVFRMGVNEPWYCVSNGSYQPASTGIPGRLKVSGLSRLPPCTGGSGTVSFPVPLGNLTRASNPVDGSTDLLVNAVVAGHPSDLAWTFRTSLADFYFALHGAMNDDSGGFMLAVGGFYRSDERSYGIACVGHSDVKELNLDAGGPRPVLHATAMSPLNACPGTPVAGSLTMIPD